MTMEERPDPLSTTGLSVAIVTGSLAMGIVLLAGPGGPFALPPGGRVGLDGSRGLAAVAAAILVVGGGIATVAGPRRVVGSLAAVLGLTSLATVAAGVTSASPILPAAAAAAAP